MNTQTIMPPVLLNNGTPIKINATYVKGVFLIERGTYPATGQPFLRILDKRGSQMTIATRAVDYYEHLPEDHCFIANYSENEGILEALIDAKIIEWTGIKFPQGFIHLYICKIIMK